MRLRDGLRRVRAATLVAAGVAAGVVALPTQAQLPVPVPPVPAVPPVSAPVPAPTLPAPPPVTPTVPAVPAAPSLPTPSAPAAPAPVAVSSAASPASTPTSTPSTSGAAETTAPPSATAGSYSAARPARPASSPGVPVRVVRSPAARRGVELRFSLARAGRVIVVLRGPLPSCSEARRFTVRGRRGANTLRFFGRVANREFEHGTYVLTLRTSHGPPGRVAVRVGPRGAVPVPRASARATFAACDRVATLAAGRPVDHSSEAILATSARRPVAPPTPTPQIESGSVAGQEGGDESFFTALPEIGTSDVDALPLVAAVVVLTLLAMSVVGLIVFLVRFFRPGSEL